MTQPTGQLHAQEIRSSVIVPVREGAGLGHPPKHFTTNANESINKVIKKALNYEERNWDKFCDNMLSLVNLQYRHLLASSHSACILLHCHGNREHTNNLLCTFLACFLACNLACCLAWLVYNSLSFLLSSFNYVSTIFIFGSAVDFPRLAIRRTDYKSLQKL